MLFKGLDQLNPAKLARVVGGLVFFFVLIFVSVSFLGVPYLSPMDVFSGSHPVHSSIFWEARLPRVILAAIVGASLSVCGVGFQALLRNPLADPYVLGVSGGAALGGVIGLALGLPFSAMAGVAFLFAVASIFLIYRLSLGSGGLTVSSLLLNGVMFNALAFALILFIHALLSFGQMHQILYLIMGSLESRSSVELLWVALFFGIGFTVFLALSPRLNILSLGDEASATLGLSVGFIRKLVFVTASFMVGASVAVSGLIGFVGLFVPHVTRLLFGNDHRVVIPASALLGAVFLMLSDFLARTLFAATVLKTQLPVGVITAIVGGPVFFYLLRKEGK